VSVGAGVSTGVVGIGVGVVPTVGVTVGTGVSVGAGVSTGVVGIGVGVVPTVGVAVGTGVSVGGGSTWEVGVGLGGGTVVGERQGPSESPWSKCFCSALRSMVIVIGFGPFGLWQIVTGSCPTPVGLAPTWVVAVDFGAGVGLPPPDPQPLPSLSSQSPSGSLPDPLSLAPLGFPPGPLSESSWASQSLSQRSGPRPSSSGFDWEPWFGVGLGPGVSVALPFASTAPVAEDRARPINMENTDRHRKNAVCPFRSLSWFCTIFPPSPCSGIFLDARARAKPVCRERWLARLALLSGRLPKLLTKLRSARPSLNFIVPHAVSSQSSARCRGTDRCMGEQSKIALHRCSQWLNWEILWTWSRGSTYPKVPGMAPYSLYSWECI